VQTILAFLFVLGVLIFVHESGHFLMARWHGVRVVTFSLGFGPKLLKLVRGGTEYCISVVPLGGYVKLAGETVEDQDRIGAPDEFLSMSKWVRFQVYLMGPVMNVLLAIVLLAVVLYRQADVPLYPTLPAVIGQIAAGGPADHAGLHLGDRVIRVNGRDVPTWDDFEMSVVPKANRDLTLSVMRGGQSLDLHLTPSAEGRYEIGVIGAGPVLRPQVGTVNPDTAAARAGLRFGDTIVAVDSQRGLDQPAVIAAIQKHPKLPMVFSIDRNGQPMDITIVPDDSGGKGVAGMYISKIETRRINPTVIQALGLSVQRNWETTVMIGRTMAGLFTRETPMKQLMGPVAIASMAGNAAQLGWVELLTFMSMISLNLGLVNLMPIPVMDGGQIAILGIEGITRRDFSLKAKERILFAGFAVIVVLMVTVIFNDVSRLLK
jgi:regulator of sigma E protease